MGQQVFEPDNCYNSASKATVAFDFGASGAQNLTTVTISFTKTPHALDFGAAGVQNRTTVAICIPKTTNALDFGASCVRHI